MTSTTGFGGGDVPHDEWRAMAAAYAIDALDASERRAFEAHLASCAECRAVVASFAPVVEGLGLAADPMAPPLDLRTRTIARATSQPRRTSVVAPVTPLRSVRATGPSWWLAAACLATAVGLGVYAMSLRQQIDALRSMFTQASAQAQALRAELASVRRDSTRLVRAIDVLSATDLHRINLAGQDRASAAIASAFVSPTRGLMFSAEHLPALQAGHVYQVWVLAPTPVSAGVLMPSATGSATATMPMPNDIALADVRAIAVTDEPNPQGSPVPTMPILLVGNVGK